MTNDLVQAALEAEVARRRRVEAELLASESRFKTLFHANMLGVIVADYAGRISDANDEYLRIIGFSRDELARGLIEWRRLTPPEWIAADEAAIEQLRRQGSCAPYAKEYARRDGVRVPVVLGATLLDRARGECVCFVLDDTMRRTAEAMLADANRELERRVNERTARMAASEARAERTAEALAGSEQRLRTLAVHLQSVREEERTRLAREIHDVLGQELTGLKMDAAWVARRLRKAGLAPEAVLERLESMEALIDSSITTVRRIATELRPGMLDDLGLVSALEWQAREYERRSGLTVSFIGPTEEVAVERVQATALFRIFQELLTNIARHAQARTVEVVLTATEERLVLEVHDDGRGISEVELSGGRSLGLLGIRERATALGGTCTIVGELGKGTVARVDLPRAIRSVP